MLEILLILLGIVLAGAAVVAIIYIAMFALVIAAGIGLLYLLWQGLVWVYESGILLMAWDGVIQLGVFLVNALRVIGLQLVIFGKMVGRGLQAVWDLVVMYPQFLFLIGILSALAALWEFINDRVLTNTFAGLEAATASELAVAAGRSFGRAEDFLRSLEERGEISSIELQGGDIVYKTGTNRLSFRREHAS